MQTIQRSYRGLWLVLDLGLDRIIIPLAIVVGLAGGAMIGSELARFQAPASQGIH
ncbi:hypothetical protein DEA8626_01506 [Defluviimonas aquaemixtae]|uniref:Uncharacterized protein n=1 Tax=Albidovulum aquaemixtae TaxID=1542388 RepID=A0A2R8B5U8_9RHOB|nr:hypothetical protein [Defluviimonas aquaemixtae]SPH17977.1 hypothetical protein DEA8626_01506 [Defluviimonas aquaemixtae]